MGISPECNIPKKQRLVASVYRRENEHMACRSRGGCYVINGICGFTGKVGKAFSFYAEYI